MMDRIVAVAVVAVADIAFVDIAFVEFVIEAEIEIVEKLADWNTLKEVCMVADIVDRTVVVVDSLHIHS
jgi:hypothetical protein